MTLEVWGVVAEVVGAIGIIATLWYLAIQVRRDTDRALSDKMMAATERWTKIQCDAMRTEESVAFLRRALNNYSDLTQDGQGRFHSIMLEMVGAYDGILDLHRRKLIPPSLFESMEHALIGFLKSPGGLQYWNELLADNLPSYLVEQIRVALARPENRPWTETWPAFRAEEAETRS